METSNKILRIGTKLACHLIGWNPNILKECGEASFRTLKKYVSAITILSIIWGVVGFCFADRYIGIDSIIGKLFTALVFIIVIICVERFIILNVGKSRWISAFRIILAILMAFLGSAIFDQIIFKHDVEVKMKEIRTEQINKEIPKRMAYLETDIQRVTNLIDSISQETVRLYGEVAKKPTIATYDVSTTTIDKGVDSIGNKIVEKQKNTVRRNVENPMMHQIKTNELTLQRYQEQLDKYQEEKMQVAEVVRKEYEEANVGFLEELSALIGLLFDDWVAMGFYLFLLGFLLLLELLVVTSKIGDATCDYDLTIEHQLKVKEATLKKTQESILNV